MEIIKDPKEMQELSQKVKLDGKNIGCVPTMGFFHQGHLSLMRRAREENEFLAVSVFVNPLQFGENEDYGSYPRDFERDKELAVKEGVDAVFYPAVEDMYPESFDTYLLPPGMDGVMCGRSRPGHFKGVLTVVAKLLNITLPDRAYFGQKDIQQALLIRRMIFDLNFPVEMKILPIIREEDGLAMSSRNKYLNREERKAALAVPKSLEKARSLLEEGERGAAKIISAMKDTIESEPLARLDYAEIRSIDTLAELKTVDCPAVLAAAVWIGGSRLIDNYIWGDDPCFER